MKINHLATLVLTERNHFHSKTVLGYGDSLMKVVVKEQNTNTLH
jgi:hypothetical protein